MTTSLPQTTIATDVKTKTLNQLPELMNGIHEITKTEALTNYLLTLSLLSEIGQIERSDFRYLDTMKRSCSHAMRQP
jgi:hypothetical protein